MVKTRQEEWGVIIEDEEGAGSSPHSPTYESPMMEESTQYTRPITDLKLTTEDQKNDALDEHFHLKVTQIEEILFVPTTDHAGMEIVSAPLTSSNFLDWSRSVLRALGARSKLEFLDGTFPEPNADSPYYKRWVRVDYLVSTWITNSISEELVNAFTRIDSSVKLWAALTQRFGRKNGPKVLKLQKEIFNFSQLSLSVMEYFNNLTAMWDEIDMLLPPINCSCAGSSASLERLDEIKLLKFLSGLNDVYEATGNQIMFINPLPSLDTAYSMIVQVEDQQQLHASSQKNSKCKKNACRSCKPPSPQQGIIRELS